MTPPPLHVPHRLPGPALEAVLLARENRFLARCRLPSGAEVAAHVPDRGRLADLLVPGARVWLFPAPGEGRKTAWSLLVAEDPRAKVLVAIDPAGANQRARPVLQQGLLPALGPGWTLWPETTLGHSRIDYFLTRGDEHLCLEVKSVGVVRDGTALFPDAPTERGVRHLEELVRYRKSGEGRAMLLFVAQRADAERVAADREIDPAFARALEAAAPFVELAAVRFEITPEACIYRGIVPVVL